MTVHCLCFEKYRIRKARQIKLSLSLSSFCEVGRTLGKLWRELSVEEKNKYRVQARQLQEKKYKEWESDLMKLSGPAQLQVSNLNGRCQVRG